MVYVACGVPRLLARHRADPLAAERADRHDRRVPRHRRPGRCSAPTPCAASARRSRPPSTTRRGPSSGRCSSNSQTLLAFLALVELRRDRRPQHPPRARRRALRRRSDPHQGDAVPAAVRGGGRVPVDVDGRRATQRAAPRPDAGRGARRGRASSACAVLPRLALVFVGGNEYAEIDDRLWLFAGPGHRALPAAAADLRGAGPPGHPLGLPGVGRAGRAAGRRLPGLDPRRSAARSC